MSSTLFFDILLGLVEEGGGKEGRKEVLIFHLPIYLDLSIDLRKVSTWYLSSFLRRKKS